MDVYSVSKEENEKFIEYGTGLSFEFSKGYAMLIFPRSSVTKKDLILKNSVGILDSGYRGELKLRFYKTSKEAEEYSVGEKIGQIMLVPLPEIEIQEVEKIENSSRGDGGFGSTGTN